MTTLLHRIRSTAQRFGIDIARYPANWSGHQLVQLLRRFEIDLVLDVGAHAGGYGTMLRRSGFNGRIVSFEPLSRPRAELRHVSADDPHWTVLPYALGDETGTATMNVAGNAGASSSVLPMLPRHRAAAPHASYTGEQPAEMHRLDTIWEQIVAPGERVFLKMDVQGYEGRVLGGAGERASECAGIQTAASFVPLFEDGLLFTHALALAGGQLGMTLMSVVPGLTDPRTGQMLQCDLVLFREDREDREGRNESRFSGAARKEPGEQQLPVQPVRG
ncbi:FkbM family methyltransferase [Streptomyces beijiangensis]|uniref:FkbM family methyltransferase n=1 Tax=Streptomyces beijiangensis TaxID=163361 RepID=A0A939F5A5_9ACTN|nr:FkbM family methyltransferase [Streptomyces beijiangensis]MBO0511754.1 FkbM family methyltransferase [Streptomyces beijiangensis]